jgi:hypothetical protein
MSLMTYQVDPKIVADVRTFYEISYFRFIVSSKCENTVIGFGVLSQYDFIR